jgi:hypothetical protein
MNPDDMQSLWNSPANRPPEASHQKLAEQFARKLIRHRRFEAVWLTNTFIWLTLITALAGWNVVQKKTSLGTEWALIPLLMVPWAFAVHFLRQHLKPAAPVARGEMTVADSFRAALGSVRTQQSNLKRVGLLLAIAVPLLAVSVWQLHGAGKVSARELVSLAIFLGATLLASGAGIAIRYFGCLRPQQRRLDGLLAELGEP